MHAPHDVDVRIAVIGAGPAGLSCAYFLRELGYSDVVIFDRNDRVGGKCLSLTVDGRSFDLGANYVTSAYRLVQSVARKVGADLYTEGRVHAFDTQARTFRSVFSEVVRESSVFTVGWQSLKYLWKRRRLNAVISPEHPGYGGISAHPELCRTFEEWLEQNGLSALAPLFEVPVTLMGYGKLTSIPAAYALTYQPVATFLDLVLASINPKIRGYPRRFVDGFQRFWERVSWSLDSQQIRLNTTVTGIRRGDRVEVDFSRIDPASGSVTHGSETFDYLFVCVPLYLDSVASVVTDLTPAERDLFGRVIFDPFVITTYRISGCEAFTAGTFILPEPPIGEPYVVNRQFADSDYLTFYTRGRVGQPVDREAVLEANARFMRTYFDRELPEPYTYNDFVYFPHVTPQDMAGGFYRRAEAMQGQNRTFYVGGLMNFELVETIMNYARHLVRSNFPSRN